MQAQHRRATLGSRHSTVIISEIQHQTVGALPALFEIGRALFGIGSVHVVEYRPFRCLNLESRSPALRPVVPMPTIAACAKNRKPRAIAPTRRLPRWLIGWATQWGPPVSRKPFCASATIARRRRSGWTVWTMPSGSSISDGSRRSPTISRNRLRCVITATSSAYTIPRSVTGAAFYSLSSAILPGGLWTLAPRVPARRHGVARVTVG